MAVRMTYLHLEPLILQQKRVVRTMTNANRFDNTGLLFKALELLKFRDMYRFQLLTHMFNSRHLANFQPDHNYPTRNSGLPRSKFYRFTKTQRAVSYTGTPEWNRIPLELRQITSPNLFKKKLKMYFIDQY